MSNMPSRQSDSYLPPCQAAQSRGGRLHKVLVHDSALGPAAAQQVWTACARHNPAMGGRLPLVQALWRGCLARRGAAGELVRTKVAAATRQYPPGTRVMAEYCDGGWYWAEVEEIKADGKVLVSWEYGWSDYRVRTLAQLRLQ